ncbi:MULTISPECIES: sugar ABC transporter ATP-binding protein [unclassified Microbacterium]|uniref:sugar ABC transporter ATP-binding protein n=1 Tax=unclassified Microbacterium TaxID=2609290 RepID=UPI0015E1AB0E|nr:MULTISPECIES: sugar ABC transporter ATP-binding protein [unclassified Microbacterium]
MTITPTEQGSRASADPDRAILRVESVSKRFGPTIALRDASLDVRAGEIHALVGENGSGKSTLVKILSGVHAPTSGTIAVTGRSERRFRSPAEAQAAGIFTVFQEVLSIESRSVLENLWLGSDGLFASRLSREERMGRAEDVLAELLESPPSLSALVEDLTLSERQVCSIARALLRDPQVLILDEATSALDYDSRTRLFATARRLRDEGKGLVLITHRMDEVEEIGDRITVLRSGVTVGTLDQGEWTVPGLVEMMTGGDHLAPADVRAEVRERRPAGEVVLRARDVALAPGSAPVTLDVRAGEMLGLAGLEGQGQDVFLRALAGFGQETGEVVRVDGSDERVITSHASAHREGIAYVPRERRAESLFEWMSILDNFAISTIADDARGGFVRASRTTRRFEEYVEPLRIKYGRATDAITTLSGGNQQKVVIARWLATRPRILLLNDPTRGIDINAKRDLYRLLADLTAEGLAVVMLSTEVDEHIELMDRVLVFNGHECSAVLDHAELTREALVSSFFGRENAL